MRRISFIISLVILAVTGYSQTHEIVYGDNTHMKEIQILYGEHDPIKEWVLKDSIPDGKWIIYRDESKKLIKSEGMTKNSKLDSTWVKYDKKGKKAKEITYRAGILNGQEIFFNTKTGSHLMLFTYRNGFKHGPYFIFHPSGVKWEEGTYKSGVPHGQWKYWDKEGKLITERTFQDGVLIEEKSY